MALDKLQADWERLGTDDPFWAVLTDPSKAKGQWDPPSFYATGRRDVAAMMLLVAEQEVAVGKDQALDFGCGTGRLTQALADHFEQVTGIDVAASMIAQAIEHNDCGERCRFVHNPAEDLAVCADGTFDFVCSLIVLQHMEPGLAAGYLGEFLRVLKPGGVAVFQVPHGPRWNVKGTVLRVLSWRPLRPVLGWLRRRRDRTRVSPEMHVLRRERVAEVVCSAGGELVAVVEDRAGGPNWVSYTYVVRKV